MKGWKIVLISSVWHNNQYATWTPQNIRNNPSKYVLRTCYIRKQSGCFHLVKVQSETRSWSTGRGLSLMHTYVSLNDAFLVRYISGGPTRNWCHVTAIDIIGRRTPNRDAEVFCCKIWSKIVSYFNKHEIWPKYGILSQWSLHTKLYITTKCVFTVLSTSSLSQSHLPETALALKHQEYCHNFIEWRQKCASSREWGMGVFVDCWLSLLTSLGTGPLVTEFPFCAGIELGRCISPSTVFSQSYDKKRSFGVLFMVSRVNAYSEWICTGTLITYHMYLFWHDQVWRHRLHHIKITQIFFLSCVIIWLKNVPMYRLKSRWTFFRANQCYGNLPFFSINVSSGKTVSLKTFPWTCPHSTFIKNTIAFDVSNGVNVRFVHRVFSIHHAFQVLL